MVLLFHSLACNGDKFIVAGEFSCFFDGKEISIEASLVL